jgi:hypothetical protein
VQLDERLRDSKSKPRTLVTLGKLAFDLFKRAPKSGERVAGNTNSGVGDGERDAMISCPSAYGYAATRWCELDSVGEQVQRDLLERAAVCAQF